MWVSVTTLGWEGGVLAWRGSTSVTKDWVSGCVQGWRGVEGGGTIERFFVTRKPSHLLLRGIRGQLADDNGGPLGLPHTHPGKRKRKGRQTTVSPQGLRGTTAPHTATPSPPIRMHTDKAHREHPHTVPRLGPPG